LLAIFEVFSVIVCTSVLSFQTGRSRSARWHAHSWCAGDSRTWL